MTATQIQRGIEAINDAADRAASPQELFERVSERLRRVVPFDGSAWFGADPATLLPTAPARIENVESGHCETYWVREATVEDVMLFRDLARSETGAASLHEFTDAMPARSARHREFLAPQGYDDELRATFRTGARTWGMVSLFRESGRRSFDRREVEVVRIAGQTVASGLRRFAGMAAAMPGADTPGTALFDAAGHLLSLDAQADRWLAEVAGVDWRVPATHAMTPIVAVISRATMVAAGRDRRPATARVQTATGRWLFVQASCLNAADGTTGGPVAVTISPAKSAQIAPIIVEAYGLTPREQQITQAVARGLANQDIALALHLSPHTVRDHLKAIFAKLGVGSRGELVAKLFADHYGPALHDIDPAQLHGDF